MADFDTVRVGGRDDPRHSSWRKKIKKQQFTFKPLAGQATTAPEMWAAVLVARSEPLAR
jgi:hypothetical protein